VIDDDLGRSAAGGVQRAGLERMVAIEMCRVVDTVLVDQETGYAPRHGNNRLLLGLKGSLNEYELDLRRPPSQGNESGLTTHQLRSRNGDQQLNCRPLETRCASP